MQQMHFWSDYETNGFNLHAIQYVIYFFMNFLCHFLHESITDVESDISVCVCVCVVCVCVCGVCECECECECVSVWCVWVCCVCCVVWCVCV